MASGKGREIKTRIRSIQNTQKITKAMELVASSRLLKAKEQIEHSRPYFQTLFSTLNDIAYSNRDFASPYVKQKENTHPCYIIIAGDRGLAGGYNSNLFQKAEAVMQKNSGSILPIGKKTVEWCERNQFPIVSKEYTVVAQQSISQCFAMAQLVCNGFLSGEFSSVTLVYTNFVSMLEQSPATIPLLPLSYKKGELVEHSKTASILYEPSSEAVYNAIVPEYIAGMVYGAIRESEASELGARHKPYDAFKPTNCSTMMNIFFFTKMFYKPS